MNKISFCGYEWDVKDSNNLVVGPGPNLFSGSPENVFLDEKGLHLKTTKIDNEFFAAEVVLSKPLGFGIYEFEISSDLNNLEKNHVLGAFLYEDDNNEIDIEFSQKMVGKNKGQYVVQPGKIKGNVIKFKIPSVQKSYHKILWNPEYINFESRILLNRKLIHKATYKGGNIPQSQNARIIFNLWLFLGKKPSMVDEVVISDFKFNKI